MKGCRGDFRAVVTGPTFLAGDGGLHGLADDGAPMG